MSNYLKKLAYIKRELVKLAASNEYGGLDINMPMNRDLGLPTVEDYRRSGALRGQPDPYEGIIDDLAGVIGNDGQSPSVLASESRAALGTPDLEYMEHPVPRPNNVGNMRTMQPAYQWDPNIPVTEEIPVLPQPTLAYPYNQQAPVSRLQTKSYAQRGPMYSILDTSSTVTNPYNRQTPQTKAQPRSIVTSATEPVPYRYKGKNYSRREMQKRIDRFQKEYLRRYAAANGLTEDAALARLKENGKWYDTSDMTTLVSQMNANKRLRNIARGKKTVDNLKWRITGGGQADGMRGMNYATVQQAMDDLREQKMNRMLQKPRRAAERALQNPAAMPGMPASIDNTPQKPVSTPPPGPTEIDSKNLARAQAMTDDENYVLGKFRSKVGL